MFPLSNILDWVHEAHLRRAKRSESAKKFVDVHLDPLLKATDELVGKLVSLAKKDFKSLRTVNLCTKPIKNKDLLGLIYLIAKLWANIEIIRQVGLSISIKEDDRGSKLQNFLACIESPKNRIVDRLSQRAVGELLIDPCNKEGIQTISFVQFVRLLENDPDMQRWIFPLLHYLSRTPQHTSERQRLLKYGIVLHALIDTLDPNHVVTRGRPTYPRKLSKKSRQDIKYRVFRRYLKFVPTPEKYFDLI